MGAPKVGVSFVNHQYLLDMAKQEIESLRQQLAESEEAKHRAIGVAADLTEKLAECELERDELVVVLNSLYLGYCSAMKSEYDFPGDPWSPERDDDDVAIAARATLERLGADKTGEHNA